MSDGIKIQLAIYLKDRPKVMIEPYVDSTGVVDTRLVSFAIDGAEYVFFKAEIQKAIELLDKGGV